jgi:hypothetical protein
MFVIVVVNRDRDRFFRSRSRLTITTPFSAKSEKDVVAYVSSQYFGAKITKVSKQALCKQCVAKTFVISSILPRIFEKIRRKGKNKHERIIQTKRQRIFNLSRRRLAQGDV